MVVKATVTFGQFEFIKSPDASIFNIPAEYAVVSRKEGMKTLESKKKRLAVANVIS
jgi:hypothetical protein